MDLLSRIVDWLGENEATISAVMGISSRAAIVLAGPDFEDCPAIAVLPFSRTSWGTR